MPLAPGRELSHYRLLERIGEGGMGVVWKAADTSLGREVAIKVLPEDVAGDPERMARFEREARLLASLNHPHIASVYGVGSAEGVRFLAMELVEGDDLAARIGRGAFPVEEAVEVARQIAEALEAAHERGIVHRDLKPANVKLTPAGQVKVLDFGLAKALEGGAEAASGSAASISPTITSPMTGANVILGTAAYMSPEQARGKTVDRRADIWAFGCVLYECLTGRRAFGGETVSDTIARILEREPDLKALPGGTPPRVRELLQRCLAKDPKLRLRDIGDARIALDEVLAARSPSGRLLVAEAPGAEGGKRRVPVFTLALAGIVGLGLGAGLWNMLGPRAREGAGPSCLTVTVPADVTAIEMKISPDGRTLVMRGRPKTQDGPQVAPPRLYARPLDRYEFKELPGTVGAIGFGFQGRGMGFVAPISPGAPQLRAFHVPLDGSGPATAFADWRDSWRGAIETKSGDMLVGQAGVSFVMIPAGGGAPSSPVAIDAGRPGVSFYEIRGELPGDRGGLVNVVSYDARGWHYSVGVMDLKSGKVKVVEEDGGNAVYSPTGHLLFARGEDVLAVSFDLGHLEARGAPIAVWSGLSTGYTFVPGAFQLTREGGLFYRPGQAGGNRSLAVIDAAGRLERWSPEQRAVDQAPEPSPDGRRFACSIVSARGIDELWISDVSHPSLRRLGTDPNADCTWPNWSPDGGRIAYRRMGRDGRDGIYIQDAEGGEATRVLKPEGERPNYIPVSWLPDGSALLLEREEGGRRRLEVLPLGGGLADTARLRRLLPSAFNEYNAKLSRDGRLLVFGSDESGRSMSYVAEFHPDGTTGRPVKVETSGSAGHLWSRDGKTLFVQDERHRLMKFTVSTTPTLSISAPIEVLDLEKLGVAMWNVLSDGRFFVGLKSEDEGEITRYNLVLDWAQELKRKMRAAR